MEMHTVLGILIFITLIFSWNYIFDLNNMGYNRKVFLAELIKRKIGNSLGDLEGFIIVGKYSKKRQILTTIVIIILLPLLLVLAILFGIPGLLYIVCKNIKCQSVKPKMGLTGYGIFVAYAAPIFCFPWVPGAAFTGLIIILLLNRFGLLNWTNFGHFGKKIIARTESSYILITLIEPLHFTLAKPQILPRSQCNVSMISTDRKKSTIEFSDRVNRQKLILWEGQSFANVPESEASRSNFLKNMINKP